jgi:Plasmid pRiA4b ORF-3-like protein
VAEDGGRCARCGTLLPSRAGGGRRRQYCGATCRSAARRVRTPPPARCSVRAGAARCSAAADGRWHDTRGVVIAWTCAAHRELAGELARAGLPAGRRPDRWLPASIAWHPAPPAVTGPAFTLTVRLDEVHPPVWRQVQVPAASTLADLHEVIQVVMGWAAMHLWKFGPLLYGELRGDYDPAVTLDGCLARPGDVLGYVYDFGDLWVHRITLDKVTARPRVPLPRCLAGRRACPPEDCGGPWGYETALKGLRARKGWAYRMARDTCGPRFDPESFDKTEINHQLAALAPAATP